MMVSEVLRFDIVLPGGVLGGTGWELLRAYLEPWAPGTRVEVLDDSAFPPPPDRSDLVVSLVDGLGFSELARV